MPNCYEFCFGIAKCIYNFFIFLSCKTHPLIEDENKHNQCYKNGVKYCKMCDLDDFVNQPSPPLEKVEQNLPLKKVDEPTYDFVFSPPFPPFYNPIFNKNQLQH